MSKNYTENIQTLFTYREEIHKDLVTRLSFYALRILVLRAIFKCYLKSYVKFSIEPYFSKGNVHFGLNFILNC